MNEQELKEIMAVLQAQGFNPLACTKEVPVMTASAVCGKPEPMGDECVERIMELPLRDDIRAIVVKVHGNSMVDAGYVDGDQVVVELQPTAETGDIVLAVLDGECTMKVFVRDGRQGVLLVPQNKTFPAIPVTEKNDFFIIGVVQGLYRRQARLSQNDLIDYIVKAREAAAAGRPQHKSFADIVVSSHRQERLDHIHSIMAGRRGKEAAFVMQTAHQICWLLERPSFESVEKEFGSVGAKSNFYKYLQLRMTKEEKDAYFELFREADTKIRAAILADLEAESDDEEV